MTRYALASVPAPNLFPVWTSMQYSVTFSVIKLNFKNNL